jgi:hypothetical protein
MAASSRTSTPSFLRRFDAIPGKVPPDLSGIDSHNSAHTVADMEDNTCN